MSRESPEVQGLFDLIAECLPLAVELDAPVFRSAGVKYANEKDFVSGEGAGYNGGRWNPPGIKAIYASLDPVTAVKESFQEFAKYGFKSTDIKPRVIAGAKVNVRRLLDLTDARIRRKLGFPLDELTQEDWAAIQNAGEESWTQAIGRGCRAAGFEGLLAPSARHRPGKNVVVFPDKLDSDSSVDLIAPDELPPHPSQWARQPALLQVFVLAFVCPVRYSSLRRKGHEKETQMRTKPKIRKKRRKSSVRPIAIPGLDGVRIVKVKGETKLEL
ncbi:MAG: RES family NAD+ phosphorylase, partial [Thermoguttaceae bacterium]